jgi:hypothetical protein
MKTTLQGATTTSFERFFAILGAGLCLVVTLLLWWGISKYQSMWLLPGLYFIELVLLGGLGAFSFIRGGPRGKFLTWGAAGALLGFSILGAFSVGFFYLPAALIFIVICVTSAVRNKQRLTAGLGVCLAAGLAQVALMAAAIHIPGL